MDEVVGPRFFLVQTILGSKKFGSEKMLVAKMSQIFCLSPEMFFGPQKFLLKKNYGFRTKIILGPKQLWVKKKIWV